MEWLKSVPSSSAGPPPMPVQQPIPSDDEQRHIHQMLLAMHSVPPGSRWAAPPVGNAGHVTAMPRAAAVHPGMQHANHVAAQSVDSAVEQSVSLLLLSIVHCTYSDLQLSQQ